MFISIQAGNLSGDEYKLKSANNEIILSVVGAPKKNYNILYCKGITY